MGELLVKKGKGKNHWGTFVLGNFCLGFVHYRALANVRKQAVASGVIRLVLVNPGRLVRGPLWCSQICAEKRHQIKQTNTSLLGLHILAKVAIRYASRYMPRDYDIKVEQDTRNDVVFDVKTSVLRSMAVSGCNSK